MGFNKGKQPKIYTAPGILQGNRLDITVVHRGDMNAVFCEKTVTEGKSLGTVMVAADDQNGGIALGKAAEEIIKQAHCFCRGGGLVINITAQ